MIRFVVHGVPSVDGSAFWHRAVVEAALRAAESLSAPLCGPLRVDVEYRFPMPPSCPKSRRNVGRAWAIDAPARHDLDAGLLDGMVAAGLIRSAAQVCAGESIKVETIGMIGASITLTELAILERSDRPGG